MGKVTIPINLSDPVVLQRFQHHLAQRWLQEHAVEGGSGKTYKPRFVPGCAFLSCFPVILT